MLKIILADNQAIFRTGAAKVLAVEDDLRIVAQAENTEKMMMALEKFHATVMIFGVETHPSLPTVVETARSSRPSWWRSPRPDRTPGTTSPTACMA